MTLASILAINWQNETQGIIVVVIGFAVLCGSVYMLLGTNLGARLGFLVSVTALAGWLAIMGLMWWIYAIGLKGPAPTWKNAGAISLDGNLHGAGVLKNDVGIDGDANGTELLAEGWTKTPSDARNYGQASSAASAILESNKVFASGQYIVQAVFEKGGGRYPLIANRPELDFFAFLHDAHYAIVEVQGVITQTPEPGRAPAKAIADPGQPKHYVVMKRDAGGIRENGRTLTLGGTLIFAMLCIMLHRRDRIVTQHVSGALEKASAGS
jgi:hypothetical protein